ncbi:MAG: carboxymuconolactone decarboxylase family protein [Proteobacteria bacterium]|nr:carboxymuconolactone decarboxylase family protein [Pseudomonadota bacterium]
MSIEQLKIALPDFSKDIRLNLDSVLTEEGSDLSQKQIYSIALSTAYATKNSTVIDVIETLAMEVLTPEEMSGVKAAAVIMAMNNIYYRFIHLVNDKEYTSMPAKLRMNVIAKPGIDKIIFELCCLAVSTINGCGLCMESHAQALVRSGVSKLAIQSAVRIAAVINAAAIGIELG